MTDQGADSCCQHLSRAQILTLLHAQEEQLKDQERRLKDQEQLLLRQTDRCVGCFAACCRALMKCFTRVKSNRRERLHPCICGEEDEATIAQCLLWCWGQIIDVHNVQHERKRLDLQRSKFSRERGQTSAKSILDKIAEDSRRMPDLACSL